MRRRFLPASFRPLCFSLLLALLLAALPAASQRPSPAAPVRIKTAAELQAGIARVDQLFAAEYAKDKLASVTVGVVSGPSLVWTKSYGLANMEKKIPADKDSTYRIGSITKQFTAVMLLQLVGAGKVRLSDPVEKYYPEIRNIPNAYPSAPPVTLLQLATHTSGLAREPGDKQTPTETFLTGQVADWEKTLLAALPHTHYAYEPGTRYSYSNIGYAILGAALGRAAGEPYTRYVDEHILAPLGMTHTAFEQNPAILQSLTQGYDIRNGVADPGPTSTDLRTGRGYKVPNGALFTTVGDLARFLSFEMGNGPETVLKRSSLNELHARVYSANGDLSFGYGMGFMLLRQGDVLALGHSGSVAGFLAGCYYNPPSHTGVIFLRNAGGGSGFRGERVVLDALAALNQ
ncbi:MAG TPA: serine hydrolase domain-containing protein [Candidatus Acidoferrales bacterium]|nr:serine hydrolase domain-containing protein [Candidatus Acidoferrales bacterium]